MEINELLMKALTSYDKSRPRSQQKELGVSSIGGCARAAYFVLNSWDKENETIKLPALMEVKHDGLMGHIDLWIPSIGAVVDWKTTKKAGLSYFPSNQQRWQVQLYGYLLTKNDHEVKTVTLVAIPRDGDERDIVIHTEEYSEAVALEALAWLENVKAMTEPPAPENYASFCSLYCNFYGESCGGKGKVQAVETLSDSVIISAAENYVLADKQIKELTAKKDDAKAVLENVDGVTPSGIKIAWSVVSGRKSIDEIEVEKLLGYVPTKQGEPSMRLSVK